MIKDQSFLDDKASYCIDSAKKNGATDVQVSVGNSVSETVNFRNKKLDESERSDTLILNLTTFINKRKSTISSSNIENNNLDENNKIPEIDENNDPEYTPKLFSEESYQTDEVMETKESENLNSDELFNQDSNEDEDFEIPAFLRKQKF